jgi:hypothetical protein
LYFQVYCQSNDESLPFYKVGCGFSEISNPEIMIPHRILKGTIDGGITDLHLGGNVLELRPPLIDHYIDMDKLVEPAITYLLRIRCNAEIGDFNATIVPDAKSCFYGDSKNRLLGEAFGQQLACNSISDVGRRGQRLLTPESQVVMASHLKFDSDQVRLVVLPAKCFGLCILRCLQHDVIMSNNADIVQAFTASQQSSLNHFNDPTNLHMDSD